MMTEKLLDTILENTYTRVDFYHRLGLLQEFLEHKTFTEHEGKTVGELLNTFFEGSDESPEHKAALLAWGDEFYNSFTRDNVYDQLEALPRAAEALPAFMLYIPLVLPSEEVKRLGSWVRGTVDKKLLVDLSVDTDLSVGCAFVWKGVYHNFSFRYFIDKHREEFVKEIQEYGKST